MPRPELQHPCSCVDADVDVDSNTSELLSTMLLPLIFEEEEDLPPPVPTMMKHKRRKLGLLCAHRAVAVGCSTGAGGLARSSAGKIIIPGGRFHSAMHAVMAAGSSGTGGRCRHR
jgi:hypothetical protein